MSHSRKNIRRGLIDQRDRGRRKKHHGARNLGSIRHNSAAESEAHRRNCLALEEWMRDYFTPLKDDVLAAINMTRFLQSAPDVNLSPDEKLRELAIFLECRCEGMDQPSGWHVLRRIYREALKYDNQWPWLYHSMSLSVLSCTGCLDEANPIRTAMLQESLEICRMGIAVAPKTAALYSTLGRSHYELHQTEQALESFNRGFELDPDYIWSTLYRAHCLHDLQQYDAAMRAYEAVNVSQFDGPKSWRGILLKDQLAICRLKSGDTEGALRCFERSLHRYEQNPGLLYAPQYLIEAAKGPLAAQLAKRVDALLEKEGWPKSQ